MNTTLKAALLVVGSTWSAAASVAQEALPSEVRGEVPAPPADLGGWSGPLVDAFCDGTSPTDFEAPPTQGACVERVDPKRGRFHVQRGERSTSPRVELRPDEDYPNAAATAVVELTRLGLDPAQLGTPVARYLNSEPVDGSGPTQTHGVLVWVERQVDGVPVAGHRAIVEVNLDMTVRSVRATWPPLSRTGQWALPRQGRCSLDDVDRWVLEEVQPLSIEDAIAGVLLVPRTAADAGESPVGIDLRLVATAMTPGLGGSRKRQVVVCESE